MKPDPETSLSGSGLPGFLCGALLCIAGGYVLGMLPGVNGSTEAFHRVAFDSGCLAIGIGFIILMSGLVFRLSHAKPAGVQALVGHGLLIFGLVAGCVLFTNRFWETKTAVVDGVRFFWLDDDMMISMRYAANLVAGHGAVWNPGEPPVEGYTNPLWMLTMTLPHLAGAPSALTSLFILILNGGLYLLMLYLTWKAAGYAGLGPMTAGWVVLMLAFNRWVIYWAVGGSEALLMGCLIMIVAMKMMRAGKHRPLDWSCGLLLGCLGVVRSDALVVVAVLLGVWFSLSRAGRTRPWSWLAVLLLPAGLFIVRHQYYGEWLPNTYYLRMSEIPTRVMFGVFYGSYFMLLFGGVVATALAAVCIHGRVVHRGLAVLPPVILLYAVYAGGDELAEYRFFVPVVSLLLIYSAWVIERATDRWRRHHGVHALNAFVLVVLVMGGLGFRSLAMPGGLRDLGHLRGEQEYGNLLTGLLLKQHTREDARIAHFWSGAAPYFSERPALDMLGKNDRFIARLASGAGDFQPAHNKYDASYSLGLEPDVIVGGISAAIMLDSARLKALPERVSYPGLVVPLEHKLFQRYYRPGIVRLPLSMDFHGIFVREGSQRADQPGDWMSWKDSR